MEIDLRGVLAWCQHPNNPRECLEQVYKVLKVVLGKDDRQDSDEDIPSTVISAREQMYQAMEGTSVVGSTMSSSLKASMETVAPGESIQLPERTVELGYISSDKYGDGLFAIRDADYLKLVRDVHAEYSASKPVIYFPFGFGKEKDLLKVKKANFGQLPKQMVLTLKFTRWERDGKIGYSCYCQQPRSK
jgi:hypothetical protein